MIKEKIMVTLICDNCGKDSCDGTDYSCWSDAEQATMSAIESDWIEVDDKHYCPECVSYDDEDKQDIDTTPKEKPIPKGCKRFYFDKGGICCKSESEIYFDAMKPSKAREKYERWLSKLNEVV